MPMASASASMPMPSYATDIHTLFNAENCITARLPALMPAFLSTYYQHHILLPGLSVRMHSACLSVRMHFACLSVRMHSACLFVRMHVACLSVRMHFACLSN